MKKQIKPLLILSHNGDPYGRGFTASEHRVNEKGERDERFGIYRGDIGTKPRWWWRNYARKQGFALREA